jgi:methylmalonyl-CoA mutase cobalamin-binding domain/chain
MIDHDMKEALIDALLSIDRIEANEQIERVLAENPDFSQVEELIIESLRIIGDGWETGQYALSQVYMSGIICEEIINRLITIYPTNKKNNPKMAIGVLLDYHALGKRIVTSVLRSSGYEILDFGYGLSVDQLVKMTLDEEVEILLISTLMFASALKVKEVKEKLMKAGKDIKIIVGGAPFRFDKTLWEKVDADFDGKSATEVVSILESRVI